jgi:hypothetical protein
MPTTIVKTVKPSGGDYTSLSAWESGQQGDLVTNDQIQQAECYAMVDTTAIDINGWTTDATRYIRVTVPTAERHDGKRNTSKYRIVGVADFAVGLLQINEDYVRCEGLALRNTSTVDAAGIRVNGATTDIIFSDCIVYDCGTNGSGFFLQTPSKVTLLNCVSMNNGGSGIQVGSGGATVAYAYNCTSVNNVKAGFTVAAFRTLHSKNCYAGGNTLDDFETPTDATHNKTTCHSEDATGNTTTAFSTSSGAYFTNVTAGSEDVHIGASSALKDVGTDLSGDSQWVHPGGNVDIDGQARSTWDIGADEYMAAAGGPGPALQFIQPGLRW